MKQVIQCGDGEIMYFLNNGWEILGQAPNPFPCPYIYFFLQKEVEEKFTKEQINDEINKAQNF